MSETNSPLAGLVLFMVGLAIFGSMIAGFHYFAIDLPYQKNIQTPDNMIGPDFKACIKYCGDTELLCDAKCKAGHTADTCIAECHAEADVCEGKCVL